MGILDDAIERAAQQEAKHTPPPVGAPARMRYLVDRLGSVKATAALLGVSPSTVRRYTADRSHHPRPALADALTAQLHRHWKPGLQRRAINRGKTSGFVIECRARFGYVAPGGSTDESRERHITQFIPAATARGILDAHQAGTPEDQLHQQLADALAFHYFQDGGKRAQNLAVEFGEIDYLDVDL